MMKKQKIRIFLAVIVALAFCSYVGFEYYKETIRSAAQFYWSSGYYSGKFNLEKSQAISESAVAVEWQLDTNSLEYEIYSETMESAGRTIFPYLISSRYLVRNNIKVRTYGSTYTAYNKNRTDQYWTLDIYDLNDLSQGARTLNIFEEIDGDDYTSIFLNTIYYDDEGNEYLAFILYNRQDKTSLYKLVNLSNGDVTEVEREVSSNLDIDGYQIYTSDSSSLLNGTNIQEVLEGQGISVTADLSETTVSIQSDGELTSVSQSWQLYEQYQSAYEILKSGGSIYLTSSDLDEILDVFELFFKDSDTLYKGLTIYADYSTDGQEHTVNSYDEFVQYFKTSTDEEAS